MFLEVQGIRKSFGTGDSKVDVLKGLDLQIERGEFCVLLGPSGSGKSTLLNIIGGIDAADAGSITIDGERLEEKAALPKLYHEIGEAFAGLDCWSEYLITSYEDTERSIGKKADKKRKIYNGMLRTNLYQYIGPKPPRRKKTEA